MFFSAKCAAGTLRGPKRSRVITNDEETETPPSSRSSEESPEDLQRSTEEPQDQSINGSEVGENGDSSNNSDFTAPVENLLATVRNFCQSNSNNETDQLISLSYMHLRIIFWHSKKRQSRREHSIECVTLEGAI